MSFGAPGEPGTREEPRIGVFPTSLNVKDYGAAGDGVTDDTGAIQAAAIAASEIEAKQRGTASTVRNLAKGTKSSAYPEIYFPEGTYLISDTVLFQQSVYLRGSGKSVIKQTDPTKDGFYFHYSFRVGVDNLAFDGGKTQLKFWTGNIWSRILVARCLFSNSSDHALECNSFTEERLTGEKWNRSKPWPPYLVEAAGGQWKLTPNKSGTLIQWYNSTVFSIESCHFENCMKALSAYCDTTFMRDCSIVTNPEMEGAPFDLGGQIHVHGLKGKARLNPGKHQYWVDGDGNMAFRDIELDTDSDAGLCFVRSSGKPGPTARGLRIENAAIKSGGSRENAIAWIQEGTMPNILSITNVKETSGKPVKAVVWEAPDPDVLETIKFYSGTSLAGQFKVVIGNNGENVDNTVPDAFLELVEKPIPNELLKETFVAPVAWNDAPAAGGEWTLIDARKHGVNPASQEDQTVAIQKVFDLAAQQPDAVVVFPGAATYAVSDTIRLPSVVRVIVAGVSRFIQADPKKDLFHAEGAVKVVFRNCDFFGGRNAVSIRSAAEAKSSVLFDYCSFYDQQGAGINCFAGKGEGEQPNQTELFARNAIFRTEQAVVTNAARSRFEAFWAVNDPHLNDKAFFENHGGEMRIQAMLGNPRLWFGRHSKAPDTVKDWPYSRNTRWIDNWGKLYCEDNRFGGESGGMCNVFNRSPRGTVHIGGGMTRSNNDGTRKAIVFAQETPRLTVLQDISSTPGGNFRVMSPDGTRMEEPGNNIHATGVLTP